MHTAATRAIAWGLSIAIALPSTALAGQSGEQVIAGQATFNRAAGQLTVEQLTGRAIIGWEDFSIDPGELVKFIQPSADAAVLNRVLSGLPSELFGTLEANGQVFLINPNGIVVGADGVVDTGAFLATTLDVADDAFLAGGLLAFAGDSSSPVTNLGTIVARSGDAALLAHTVVNEGTIQAPAGVAVLAAGNDIFYSPLDDRRVLVRSSRTGEITGTAPDGTGVDNSGRIEAARAELAAADGHVYALAVNQSGYVEATGARHENGRVILTADGGTVGHSGTIVAHNENGDGGEILIGGDYQGANPSIPNADYTAVTAEAVIDVNAAAGTGNGGRLVVWSDQATRFFGTASARAGSNGGDGGFAEISGKHSLDFRPQVAVDLRAPAGTAGTLLLDPDAIRIVDASLNPAFWQSSGTDPVTFTPADSNQTALITNEMLQDQLAVGDVTLFTAVASPDGDITFDAPVTWTNGNTLTASAGAGIFVNAAINGGSSSTVELFGGMNGSAASDGIFINAPITTGTLRMGFNGLVDSTPLAIGTIEAETAPILAQTVELVLGSEANPGSDGILGDVLLTHEDNAIGILTTSGDGDIGGRLDVVDGDGDLQVALKLPDTTSDGIQIVTEGNLILRDDHELSFADNPLDVVLASRNGAFINDAGSDALPVDAARQQRFFIYSSTKSATTLGGLTGEEGEGTFDTHPPTSLPDDTLSRIIYAAADTLLTIVLSADDVTREYGEENPFFSYSVSGLADGDTLTGVTNGVPAFLVEATASSNAGEYTITITQGSLTLVSDKYSGFVFKPGTLTITPAPLTLTIGTAKKQYGADGTSVADIPHTMSGFKLDDDESDLQDFALVSEGFAATSDAGSYSLEGRLRDPNYILESVELGTLEVTPAPLVGRIGDVTREYGEPTEFSVEFSGFVNGDDESVIESVEVAADTPQTDLKVPVGTYRLAGTATAKNYAVLMVPGNLTVTEAPLVLSVNGNFQREYGDANPLFGVTVRGLKNGETAQQVVNGLGVFTLANQGSGVGTYELIPTGVANQNYRIVRGERGTLTITPAPLVLSADDKTRMEGLTNPALTFTVTGLKNGDPASIVSGAALTVAAGPASLAGDYTIVISGGSAPNYEIVAREAGTLTVEARPEKPVLYEGGDENKTVPLEDSNFDPGKIDFNTEHRTDEDLCLSEAQCPTGGNFRILGPMEGGMLQVLRDDTARFLGAFQNLLASPENQAIFDALPSDVRARITDVLNSGNVQDLETLMLENGAVSGLMRAALVPYLKAVKASGQRPPPQGAQLLLMEVEEQHNAYRAEFHSRLQAKYEQWKAGQLASGRTLNTLFANPPFADLVSETTAEMEAWVEGLVVGGVTAGGAAAVAGTTAALVASGVAASALAGILPNSLAFAAGGAGLAVTSAAVAGPLSIVVAAVAIGVIGGIQAFESAANEEQFYTALADYAGHETWEDMSDDDLEQALIVLNATSR